MRGPSKRCLLDLLEGVPLLNHLLEGPGLELLHQTLNLYLQQLTLHSVFGGGEDTSSQKLCGKNNKNTKTHPQTPEIPVILLPTPSPTPSPTQFVTVSSDLLS